MLHQNLMQVVFRGNKIRLTFLITTSNKMQSNHYFGEKIFSG